MNSIETEKSGELISYIGYSDEERLENVIKAN